MREGFQKEGLNELSMEVEIIYIKRGQGLVQAERQCMCKMEVRNTTMCLREV